MVSTAVEVVGRSVSLPAADAFVVADIHLGKGRRSAVELPVGEGADILERLEARVNEVEPSTVVLAGDILHSFDRVPTGVSETLVDVRSLLEGAAADLVVLEGNHDTMLSTLVEAPVQSEFRLDDETVVAHGHLEPIQDADRYLIGHEHPAIRIEGQRYPCALDCAHQYEGADVFVLPAFTRLARGTLVNDLDAADSLSPLVTDLDRCRPIVELEDEPLRFPPLGEFRDLL